MLAIEKPLELGDGGWCAMCWMFWQQFCAVRKFPEPHGGGAWLGGGWMVYLMVWTSWLVERWLIKTNGLISKHSNDTSKPLKLKHSLPAWPILHVCPYTEASTTSNLLLHHACHVREGFPHCPGSFETRLPMLECTVLQGHISVYSAPASGFFKNSHNEKLLKFGVTPRHEHSENDSTEVTLSKCCLDT